jgi:DNA recombination protein RmuC
LQRGDESERELNDPRVSLEIALMVLIVAGLAVLIVLVLKKREGGGLSIELQHLTQAIQTMQSNAAVLGEKMARLEPVSGTLGAVQLELRGLGERVSQIESGQTLAGQTVKNMDAKLSVTQATAESLNAATASLQGEISQAMQRLSEIQAQAKARQESERQSAESIRRLEAIIAGTHSKGAAGENILEVVFSALPVEWQARDFKIGNKTVEFGLRLPNRLILPIDSKWPATSLLEEFLKSEDPSERTRLKGQIADAALKKASEVTKYLDPDLTVNFGIAAIPDAAFDLCGEAQAKAFASNVVLISYSMFVPYLLLVFQTVLRTSNDLDLEKLEANLQTAQKSLKDVQNIVEGRLSRAIVTMGNARDEMRGHLARIESGLSSLRAGTPPALAFTDETPIIQPLPDGFE